MKPSGNCNRLTQKLAFSPEFIDSGSTLDHDNLLVTGHIQGQEPFVASQFATNRETDFPGSESGVLDRLGNSCGIETSSRLGCDDDRPLFQADAYFADAIQASQGFFRPVSSKGSRHAVDADLSLGNLGKQGRGVRQYAGKD